MPSMSMPCFTLAFARRSRHSALTWVSSTHARCLGHRAGDDGAAGAGGVGEGELTDPLWAQVLDAPAGWVGEVEADGVVVGVGGGEAQAGDLQWNGELLLVGSRRVVAVIVGVRRW